ncbi:hypothetical protein ABGB12_25965 [Actinocorallia sp. B10E7]|uniref:hypothetical protein n=1 Tax=Actinocorallia sp. B10E7 TaxID=3153558 RepID=UPI00325CF50C
MGNGFPDGDFHIIDVESGECAVLLTDGEHPRIALGAVTADASALWYLDTGPGPRGEPVGLLVSRYEDFRGRWALGETVSGQVRADLLGEGRVFEKNVDVVGVGSGRAARWRAEQEAIFVEDRPGEMLGVYHLKADRAGPNDVFVLTDEEDPPSYHGRSPHRRWRLE